MQTQNQQLLQQITERDDYNIKLVLEGVRARQLWNSLLMEKRVVEREIQQSNVSLDFYNIKSARLSDQKHLLDVTRASDQARESLDALQSKIERSQMTLLELQIETERER
uniref:E3 ubiquitin protein ligase n=1 Tax=Rhizophora mucronata TaxID=61149 RepID=A0A2P2K268_RHIMU